tara:strand:+ start:378 stop:1112 length:735 start_codon:yes stop_codon:yes gene_type:complete
LGSFANVCIYRLPKGEQFIFGRSKCPKCKKKINWSDNLPLISFLILNAKCRNCKKKISLQYFLVELVSGFCTFYIFQNYNNFTEIFFLQILALILLIIFFIDLKHYMIPDSLNYSLIFLGLIKIFFPSDTLNFEYDMVNSFIGGMIGFFIIFLIIYLYKRYKNIEAMGLGDAKFLAAVGLFFGWKSVLLILFMSSLMALIYVTPSLIRKSKSLYTAIPFGPYLVISSVIYFLFSDILLSFWVII